MLARLDDDNDYLAAFRAIYDDGITPDNIVNALVVFQSSLITPNSRFDRYLRGNKDAITSQEKNGYDLRRAISIN